MTYHIEFDIDFKRNTYPGKLIAIEGNDGSGKTTQVKRVSSILSKEGKRVFVTKNPTEGEVGKIIRRALSGEIEIPRVSFQYLFSADRQIQQEEVIEHLKAGDIVITDRYFWSALAYGLVDKGSVSEENANHLLVAQGILSMYHQFLLPDLTLFLSISVDEAVKRLSGMDKKKELYEQKDQLEKIDKAYKWLLSKFGSEITVVDGEQDVERVTQELLKNVASIM